MTDQQWEAQNKAMSPAEAARKGLCWQCAGKRVLYTAFGGVHRIVDCNECDSTSKRSSRRRGR